MIMRYAARNQRDSLLGAFFSSAITRAVIMHANSRFLIDSALRLLFRAAISLFLIEGIAFANDGDPDATFADNGTGYLGWSTLNLGQRATAVLSQPDGDIILVGNLTELVSGFGGSLTNSNAIAVARLLPNGQLDPTFGDTINTPGQTLIGSPPIASSTAFAAALSPNGQIVIAGSSVSIGIVSQQQASVWRLTSTGNLDATFGDGAGQVIVGQSAQFNAVLIGDGSNLPVNEIVAGGYLFDPARGHNSQFIVRLATDGTIETGYGNDTFATGGNYWVGGVQCPDNQSDSEIVALAFNEQYLLGYVTSYLYAAGNCSSSSVVSESTVIAFSGSTIADTNFGNGGLGYFTFGNTIATEPSFTSGMQTHISSNGDMIITIAGYVEESSTPGETHVGVAQVLQNGQFNTAFGFSGHTTLDFGECCAGDPTDQSTAVAMLVQHDGNIVIGVSHLVSDGVSLRTFALARLTALGARDAAFAPGSQFGGTQTYYFEEFGGIENDSFSVPYAMAFTAGEKIVMTGYIDDGSGNDYFSVLRVTNDRIFTDGFDGTPVPPPR